MEAWGWGMGWRPGDGGSDGGLGMGDGMEALEVLVEGSMAAGFIPVAMASHHRHVPDIPDTQLPDMQTRDGI